MLNQGKDFANDSGRSLSSDNFTDKSKMAAAKKQYFFAFFFFFFFGIELCRIFT